MPPVSKNRYRRWLLHAYRVGIFVFILFLIRHQHAWYVAQKQGERKELVTAEQVRDFFPEAESLSDWDPGHGGQNVFDKGGESLGYVVQTSPEADKVIGFSGPTNTLIALGKDNRVRGILVLSSGDTKEHLAVILKDEGYLAQWNGLGRDEAGQVSGVDAVSGATLTSNAIADSISTRLGGNGHTDRFPEEISIEEVQVFLEDAATLTPLEKRPKMLQVIDGEGTLIGYASRTSPFADHMLGYQGPTDLLIVMDTEERVIALAIRETYDNEPFVGYVKEDEYFFNNFTGFDLKEIAQIDMADAGIDEVTGATKTSITSAESLILAASELTRERTPPAKEPWIPLTIRDVGTMLVTIMGIVIAFTGLKGNRKLRFVFQAVLIGYLGFVNADMLSQALLVGWAQNGVAWRVAPGLVFLSAAALIAPIITGRQVYCTHLCPYGAAQDWLGRRIPKQIAIRGKMEKVLSALPTVLLVWVVVVAIAHLPFSLVALEPFDAFVIRIAGWVTITIAVIGLVAALFVPRAYCRYGCPTGAMLKFIRVSAASERFGRRDWVAAGLALLALGLTFLR